MSQQALKTFPFPSIMTPRQKDIFWFRLSKQCTVYCIYTPSQKRWQRTKLQVPHRWKKNIVCSVLINFFDWGYFVLKENNEKAHCGRASDYRGFEFCITMLLMCSRVIVLCCTMSVLYCKLFVLLWTYWSSSLGRSVPSSLILSLML